jgi:hypothetical protein
VAELLRRVPAACVVAGSAYGRDGALYRSEALETPLGEQWLDRVLACPG